MIKFFRLFQQICSIVSSSPKIFKQRLWGHFWSTYKKGYTVFVQTNPEGNELVLAFQRPILPTDVKEGVLLPTTRTLIKRRGGKRRTVIRLTPETARALHAVLGRALEDIKAKEAQKKLDEKMTIFLTAFTME